MSKTLGIMKLVDVRDYWPNEAQDFTPWLAEDENILLLGEALGIELGVEATEVFVGPYSADILARDTGSGDYVVIENPARQDKSRPSGEGDHLWRSTKRGSDRLDS